MAHLDVQIPQRSPFQVPLGDEPLRIGRTRGLGLCIRDITVSAEHAEIAREGREFVLRDLQSRNGTFVNGARVSERRLAPGDVISIGTAALAFREAPAPDEAQAMRAAAAAGAEPSLEDLFADRTLVPLDEIEADLSRVPGLQKTVALLFKLGRDLNHLDGMDRFLERLAGIVHEAVPSAERVFLLLTDIRTGDLVLRASRGHRQPARLAISATILDRATSGRVAVLTHDAIADPRFRDAESVALNRVRCVICIPLVVEGAELGAIYVDSREAASFSLDDLHLAGRIAIHAATILQNLQLFENLRQLNRDLAAERDRLIVRLRGLEETPRGD